MSFVSPSCFDRGKAPSVSPGWIMASNSVLRVVRRIVEKDAPNESPDVQIHAIPTMTTAAAMKMPIPYDMIRFRDEYM
jgi:hypothetical protein